MFAVGLRCPLRLARIPATRSVMVASELLSGAQTSCPYFVPRNSRGNLPVYTDVRNGGSRYMVLVRNVEGNANMLVKDLQDTLFEKESSEASRMKIELIRSKNLVITGGRWKNNVMAWLTDKGF